MKRYLSKHYTLKRKIQVLEELFFRSAMLTASILITLALCSIIWSIMQKGLPCLSWEMISQAPKGGFYFGKEGGILNAIAGSVYLAFGSTLLAFVIGLPVALYLNTYLQRAPRLVTIIRFILDLLWGIPSIVYGAFGFALMVFFRLPSSLAAGIIIVALLILPIMIRAIDEGLKSSPAGLKEAAYSLGSTNAELSFKILTRQCMPAIITAILLSFGRAIGDAASVLFTTGFTDNIPYSLGQPAATLPLSIFFQLSSPIPQVKERAYAAAAVLTIIILITSILSRLLSKKHNKNIVKF